MARPARTQPGSSRLCAGVLSRIAYRYAERSGVEVAPLLKQAGLTQRDIEDRSARIGVTNQIRFVELVAAALGDELLGFHLAEDFDFREIGLLYYVAASAETFGSALSRVERYIKIQNDGVDFEVIRGKALRVRMHYRGVARHTDVHQIGSLISLMIRIGRFLTGQTLKPIRVRIMHHIHRGKSGLEKFLDADVEDGARVDEIEFPAASWDMPIVSADPHLHRVCVQSCEDALARRTPAKSLEGAGGERDCGTPAPWAGAIRARGGGIGDEPSHAGAAIGRGGFIVRRDTDGGAFGPRRSLPRRSHAADLSDRLAARIRGNQRIYACISTLDRNGAERGASAILKAGRPATRPAAACWRQITNIWQRSTRRRLSSSLDTRSSANYFHNQRDYG
jgi:hypothetical protein